MLTPTVHQIGSFVEMWMMSVYDTGLDTLTSELGQVIALLDNSSDLLENQVRSSSRTFCEFSFTKPTHAKITKVL